MRRADRLFAIIQALRGGKVRRAEDIARELEVSVRTVYRDLADLQGRRVPIEGERGVGYMLRDGYFLPSLALGADEWEALGWGIAYIEAHADEVLAAAAHSLARKLAAEGAQPDSASLRVYARPLSSVFRESLSVLRDAIRQRRILDLTYRDRNDVETKRRIWPLEIEHWGAEAWTLTGWCLLRGDFRVFRLDRVSDTMASEERFSADPNRSIEAFRATLKARK